MSMLLSLGLLGAVVAATVVVALIVSCTSRGRGQVVAAPARVTGVREIAGGRGVVRLVDFELVDGRRLALVATAGLAGQVVVGQRGVVHWAGGRATGWVPELGGRIQDTHRSD